MSSWLVSSVWCLRAAWPRLAGQSVWCSWVRGAEETDWDSGLGSDPQDPPLSPASHSLGEPRAMWGDPRPENAITEDHMDDWLPSLPIHLYYFCVVLYHANYTYLCFENLLYPTPLCCSVQFLPSSLILDLARYEDATRLFVFISYKQTYTHSMTNIGMHIFWIFIIWCWKLCFIE